MRSIATQPASRTPPRYGALNANTTGRDNTASGTFALSKNTTGGANTASGYGALNWNSTGNNNTAFGFIALGESTIGSNNTASGYAALLWNAGENNTASGYQALNGSAGSTGSNNTAVGANALYSYSSGSNNIAEGYRAGYNLTTGNNNIDIGNQGAAGDTDTIKIGTQGMQAATYIAGIWGHQRAGGLPVFINSQGELGVMGSSERFKTAIAPMGSNSEKLGELRPVTFKLKSDAAGTRQYGLIAEEVVKVYPELVVRDDKGRIDGVRYDELAPMLLNEVQKQAVEIRDLKRQQKQFFAQAEQLGQVQQQLAELHAALAKLQSKGELVAQR